MTEALDPAQDVEVSVIVAAIGPGHDPIALHREIAAEIDALGVSAEYLYVATEDGADALTPLLAEAPGRVRVLRIPRRADESAVLASGALQARGDVLLTVPSYHDAALSGIPALLEAVAKGADVAFASRGALGTSGLQRMRVRAFNQLVVWSTGTEVTDVSCGLRAIRRHVLDELKLRGDFQRFLPIMAERLGFAVVEVPVAMDRRAERPGRRSLLTYFSRASDLLTLFFVSRFTRRPLRLFGAVGSVFALIGAAVLAVVAFQRLALGIPLADRPILVLGVSLLGIGVQVFTIGLLGELLVFFHAHELPEYRLSDVFEGERPGMPRDDEESASDDSSPARSGAP